MREGHARAPARPTAAARTPSVIMHQMVWVERQAQQLTTPSGSSLPEPQPMVLGVALVDDSSTRRVTM